MKKVGYRFWVALAIGGIALFGLRLLFPSDTVRIGKMLTRLEGVCNVVPGESQLTRLGRIRRLEEIFTADCQVALDTYDYGKLGFAGREELLQAASATVALEQSLTVKFPQTVIRVAESRTNAVVEVAAAVRSGLRRGETLLLVKLSLNKSEGAWRMTRVESLRSLQM